MEYCELLMCVAALDLFSENHVRLSLLLAACLKATSTCLYVWSCCVLQLSVIYSLPYENCKTMELRVCGDANYSCDWRIQDPSFVALLLQLVFCLDLVHPSKRFPTPKGSVFIERDGTHFRHVLNWLRDGVIPILDASGYQELLREAEYYQLLGFIEQINIYLNRKKEEDENKPEMTRKEVIKCIQSKQPKLRGINLSGLDLSKLDLSGVDFSHARLQNTFFSRANLQSAKFRDSEADGSNFHHANLRECEFVGASLHGALLAGANLQSANLQDASLDSCSFCEADLRSAHLQGADLTDANLSGANLEGANLKGVKLKGANLQGANLQRAYLRFVDLSETALEGAKLEGANRGGVTMPY